MGLRNLNRALEEGEGGRRYTIYLVIVALAGWALASYDLNLLVLTIPDISQELGLSPTLVGLLGSFVFGAPDLIRKCPTYGGTAMTESFYPERQCYAPPTIASYLLCVYSFCTERPTKLTKGALGWSRVRILRRLR